MKGNSSWKYFIYFSLLLALFLLFTFNNKIVIVSGESMAPALSDNEMCVATNFILPEADGVYLIVEPDENVLAIKRLIGLPGDVIELKDGVTYRNGEEVPLNCSESWDNMKWVLRSDEYLFLGDNRKVSFDNRHWSRPIHLDEIKYKLSYIIYPFTSVRGVK